MTMLVAYWAVHSILHLPTDFKLDNKDGALRKVLSFLIKVKEVLAIIIFFPVPNKKIEQALTHKTTKTQLPPATE